MMLNQKQAHLLRTQLCRTRNVLSLEWAVLVRHRGLIGLKIVTAPRSWRLVNNQQAKAWGGLEAWDQINKILKMLQVLTHTMTRKILVKAMG